MTERYAPSCATCGHKEALHHPTISETWCIVGIVSGRGEARCACPGYNPNGPIKFAYWLAAHDSQVAAQAWERGVDDAIRFTGEELRGLTPDIRNPYRKEAAGE